MEPTPGAEPPTDVRTLIEIVAERLILGADTGRLVVDLQDGRVRYLTRPERIKGTDPERF